jgi:hypothetical protein
VFHPGTFQPGFMDATWTVDLRDYHMTFGADEITFDGAGIAAVFGGRPWAWDDGTLPDPILWEGAD